MNIDEHQRTSTEYQRTYKKHQRQLHKIKRNQTHTRKSKKTTETNLKQIKEHRHKYVQIKEISGNPRTHYKMKEHQWKSIANQQKNKSNQEAL